MLCRTTASIAEAEGDPAGPQCPSLAQQRELEAVANEAVDLSIENDWVLATPRKRRHVRSTTCRLVAGIRIPRRAEAVEVDTKSGWRPSCQRLTPRSTTRS